ncbi:transposase [Xanthomonas oryzae pv. oryzae]|nr:transposase [Xanthomonas oryzae pv. oryzae]
MGHKAPVESFLGLLKRERIRRQVYLNKDGARAEVLDCIEMFYNPERPAPPPPPPPL